MKNVEDVYPLSAMQQLMLLHALSARRSEVLCEQLSCTIVGQLDTPALRRAWQTVIARHPVLRTAFVWEGLKQPLQIVRQQVELPWSEHDWRGLTPAQQDGRRAELLANEREFGFDLSQAPLIRLSLVRTAEDSYFFVWTCHHLVLDGWCLSLVLNEVLAYYEAGRRGQEPRLERPRPFRDYIAWLQRQDNAEAEAFWRRQLAGYRQPTPLPAGPRTDVAGGEQFRERRMELTIERTAALRRLAKEQKLTHSTLVQAAWALLLSQASGLSDVVFGATVSGRPASLAGVDSMVGPFINNLPVRVACPPDEELLPWLRQLQAQQAELRQYEHSPPTQIQRWSEVPSDRRLFETLVVFENYPVDAAHRGRVAGFEVRDLRGSASANFPLTLIAIPGERLALRLRYDPRRCNAAAAEKILEHLTAVLEAIAAEPTRTLRDLPQLAMAVVSAAGAEHGPTADAADAGPRRRPDSAGPVVLPRDEAEENIAGLWRELLGLEAVGVNDNFFDLGGNSTLAVQMMTQIDERFGRKLPLVALFQQATVAHLADLLRRQGGSSEEHSLVPIQPHGSKPPLFLIHPAGGTVFCYLDIARHLGPDQPVYGLQAQGVDGELPPHTQVEEMAAHYVRAIRGLQPEGPYYLGGWSSGGVLAFEVARQFAVQGQQIALLALFDAAMPGPDQSFSQDDFLPMLLMLFPGAGKESLHYLKELSPEEQLAYFSERAEQAQLVIAGANPEHAQHVFEVFQANLSAMLDYRPLPYTGQVTLFRASDQSTPMHSDPYLGWSLWADSVETHEVPGDHVTMFQEPTISAVAEAFRPRLAEAQERFARAAVALPG